MDRAKLVLTLTFKLLGRNITPLHFKTEGVAEIALRDCDFDQLRLHFPEFWRYFPNPGTLN